MGKSNEALFCLRKDDSYAFRPLAGMGASNAAEEDIEKLDQEHILSCRKESYGYLCFTDQKKYYMENYPQIIVENSGIDDMILMMAKGR